MKLDDNAAHAIGKDYPAAPSSRRAQMHDGKHLFRPELLC